MPVPAGAPSHLYGLEAQQSTPVAGRSRFSIPAPCALSATISSPCLCARSLSSLMGVIRPVLKTVWLTSSTRVRGVIALAKASTISCLEAGGTPRTTSFTTMPFRFALSRHGLMPPGCSRFDMTTSSPAFMSSPFAKKFSPSVVLRTIAISPTDAPTNLATFSRTSSSLPGRYR